MASLFNNVEILTKTAPTLTDISPQGQGWDRHNIAAQPVRFIYGPRASIRFTASGEGQLAFEAAGFIESTELAVYTFED